MNYKPNTGANPQSLKEGYTVLGGGAPLMRDVFVEPFPPLRETDNGGFLGRMENPDSASSKA